MKKFSALEAANEVGISKSAIRRACKSGKLSFSLDTNGHYEIDPAELARVYDWSPDQASQSKTQRSGGDKPTGKSMSPHEIQVLARELEVLSEKIETEKAERTREREQAQSTIDSLNKQLEKATEISLMQARLLTDESARKPAKRSVFGFGRRTA